MLSPRAHNFISYAGALLIFVVAWYAWHSNGMAKSPGPWCWVFHFLRRTLETLFVFNFSAASVPLADSVVEFAYYWLFALTIAYSLPEVPIVWCTREWVGIALFSVAELCNMRCHQTLANAKAKLGDRGGNIRPRAVLKGSFLFNVVTAPHYLFEILAWVGFNVATGFTHAGVLFNALGATIMTCYAIESHERCHAEFGRTYPAHRTPIFPACDLRPPRALVRSLARSPMPA